jgi:hypothetical protein
MAVQTPQYNRGGQDVSKSHKTPEKHVSKYNHKELQNTFQNCTQFKSQSQIEGQTILEWKRDKKPNQAKQ